MPALDRDVVGRHAAAAELLLGQTSQAASLDPEAEMGSAVEPAGTAPAREVIAEEAAASDGVERSWQIEEEPAKTRAPLEADPAQHAVRRHLDVDDRLHQERDALAPLSRIDGASRLSPRHDEELTGGEAESVVEQTADVLEDGLDDTAVLRWAPTQAHASPSAELAGEPETDRATSPKPQAVEPETQRAADVLVDEIDDRALLRPGWAERVGEPSHEEAMVADDALHLQASTDATREAEQGTPPKPDAHEPEAKPAADVVDVALDDTVFTRRVASDDPVPSEERIAARDALEVDDACSGAAAEERSSEREASPEPHVDEPEAERADDELVDEIDDTVLTPGLADEVALPSEDAMAVQDARQAETSTAAEMAAEPAGMEPAGRGMEPE
jgi:hypothetical protein